jgi:integrase
MVRLPPTKAAGKGRALTPEEIQAFLAHARHHVLGPLFELALVTGLRRGELCALNWRHVDFDQALLHVTDNVPVVKGRPQRGAPKTEAGLRSMPLALETMTFLRLHQASQVQFGWPKLADSPLFTTARGERPHPDSVTKVMRQLALESGLGRVTVHDLRHTHTSLRRRQNVPVEIVSRQVGHANVAFTLQRYRHTYSDEERAYTQGLTELLAPPELQRRA